MWNIALNNLKGRKTYNILIVFAVALAVAMALTSLVISGGVQKELERGRRLMGPDLAFVPPGTKEAGQINLGGGPPARGSVPAGAQEQLKDFPEVEAATRQRYMGEARVGDVRAALIRFEPATDFVVLPWLSGRTAREFRENTAGVVLGSRIEAEKIPGGLLRGLPVAGRLRATGTFLDTSVFFPSPEAPLAEPSWVLLRLRKDAFLDFMVNKLETNISGVEVIARPEMLKTINDQLHGLLQGGGFSLATALAALGAMLVTGAMFALMMHERRREFGLLKAMGASNAFVFRLVMGEAAALAGMGILLGLACATVWLLTAGLAGEDASSPAFLGFVLGRMVLTAALALAAGVLAALYPALAARSLEPYAAIRSGE
ncbi:MAG: FtsX-like permease family protein [Desulfovibrio sp.]|jgi:putative ABC transport system permease protein|nr:FtsX-like permease family protein [Desulfovibrio sp.]